jgi:hypothetical protein
MFWISEPSVVIETFRKERAMRGRRLYHEERNLLINLAVDHEEKHRFSEEQRYSVEWETRSE